MTITPQSILRFLVGAAITALVLFLVWYFSSVVIYILVAAVLAIVGRPLVGWLLRIRIKEHHLPRWAAAAITLVIILVAFAAIFSLFIPLIFNKINEFAQLDIFRKIYKFVEEGSDKKIPAEERRKIRRAEPRNIRMNCSVEHELRGTRMN